MLKFAKEFSKNYGYTFSRIENPGSGQGIDALLKDKIELVRENKVFNSTTERYLMSSSAQFR
ncbi:hypothetical protein [Sulfurospirillum diekertiae]|uniref:hypothetical protein n=1 Tax=Sulfurospirillum diekertiae TaxID=1854492 RepID=UPI000B4D7283|nr:hypothetical protein [Sulfurospirillum diekertiae]